MKTYKLVIPGTVVVTLNDPQTTLIVKQVHIQEGNTGDGVDIYYLLANDAGIIEAIVPGGIDMNALPPDVEFMTLTVTGTNAG